MALVSRHFAILNKIAGILNADTDLAVRNFRVRKRAYNVGNTWEAGGWVAMGPRRRPYHENQIDGVEYLAYVVIVDPTDGNLTVNQEAHAAALERVEAIFHNKSGAYMPAGLRALNTTFASGPNQMVVEQSTVDFGAGFDQGAFEKNFDVSGCTVVVSAIMPRLDATLLGS